MTNLQQNELTYYLLMKLQVYLNDKKINYRQGLYEVRNKLNT